MRAEVLRAFGGPENFTLPDIPKPEIRRGMVLVRLAATSVNQVDTKIHTGLPIAPTCRPWSVQIPASIAIGTGAKR